MSKHDNSTSQSTFTGISNPLGNTRRNIILIILDKIMLSVLEVCALALRVPGYNKWFVYVLCPEVACHFCVNVHVTGI